VRCWSETVLRHPALLGRLESVSTLEELLVDSPLNASSEFRFSLRLDEAGTWLDRELAKSVIELWQRSLLEEFLDFALVLAYFLVPTDSQFVRDFMARLSRDFVNGHTPLISIIVMRQINESDDRGFDALNAFAEIVPKLYTSMCQYSIRKHRDWSVAALEEVPKYFALSPADINRTALDRLGKAQAWLAEFRAVGAKRWRPIRSHLTRDRAPWHIGGSDRFYKRDHCLTGTLCPFRTKVNRRFDSHAQAALGRDSGRLVELPACETELHPKEVVDAISEQNETLASEQFVFSEKCKKIKVTSKKDVTFALSASAMRIGTKMYELQDIKWVLWRRMKFHPTAVEIFFRNGETVLLDFLTIHSKAIVALIAKRLKSRHAVIQRFPFHEFAQQQPMPDDWRNGRVSNMKYLMWLNMFGSRSFHDPAQYPIMPWVIADYSTISLDLKNPKTFRELGKPTGALGEARLEELKQRLEDLKQFGVAPFLFSSYCSFPLAVFLFLVRMEPFTTLHIDLQGGRFDSPHRMFSSIRDTYSSVIEQLNDYRELTPEFYFQPEFLINQNRFNLGLAHGKSVDDVDLPAWAHSAMEFVYLNRKALESEYVSRHLHGWIDLVFGYKQRGEEAEKVSNFFKHEMYDDIWERDAVKTDRRRKEIESTIDQVGQVPPQLFFAPHPHREVFQETAMIDQLAILTLPPAEYIFASFSDVRKGLYTLTSHGLVHSVDISFRDQLEVQMQRIVLKNKLPDDLTAFVRLSDTTFAAVCDQRIDAVVLEAQRDFEWIKLSKVRQHITAISGDRCFLSISQADARNHIYSVEDRPYEVFSIPTYRHSVTCSCISKKFGVVVTGTDDRALIVASICDGSTIRVIKLESVPLKVTVTSGWGFILVNGCEYVDGKPQYTLSLFNINGLAVKTVAMPDAVHRWVSWQSIAGFDFISLATKRGKLFGFEVFFMDLGRAIYRCAAELVCLEYSKRRKHLIAVTTEGKVHIIPFLTSSVEKYV
jgi:hypothetical protein